MNRLKENYLFISFDKFKAKLYCEASLNILKNKSVLFFTFSTADSKITFAIDPFNAGSLLSNSRPTMKKKKMTKD